MALSACQTEQTAGDYQEKIKNPEYFRRAVKKLTDVIVHDIFSPPVASRIYVYPSIAAYEVMSQSNARYPSLVGQLKGLNQVPQMDVSAPESYVPELASIHSFLEVGKTLIFSEEKIEAFQESLYKELKDLGIPQAKYDKSMEYGKRVAEHVLKWADKDMYKETRTFPKYTIQEEVAAWKPTPPDYMQGIEPHWNKIRPMVLDSANQFVPGAPTDFDLDKESPFYKELEEVYEVGKNLSEEQQAIAQFWDCNPYVSHHTGHAMYAVKKITPGGHWIGITAIASRQNGDDFFNTTRAYAMVSISLFDAFISCWDEKWRSILVRPETLINEYIDPDWAPLLQTPPFPEHTSGHSVISRAAAETLTKIYGDSFSFEDTTEVEYGLPVRTYKSFREASEEAAISRLYGGIHYRPACELGVEQGEKVGKLILERLFDSKKEEVALKEK